MPMKDVLENYKPDMSLLDKSNPCSLLNMAPEPMIPLIYNVIERAPKLMLYPDIALRHHCDPDERDDRLRLTFWDEYNLATSLGRRMTLRAVINKVCTFPIWNNYYAQKHLKILWIITPPRDYNLSLRQIHAHGMERLEEIMKLPMKGKNGETDYRAVGLILKTFQLVDLRVKGAILQKFQIQQQNLNINAEISSEQVQNLSEMTVEQLEAMEKKLDRLQRIEQKALNVSPETRAEVLEGELVAKELTDDATLAKFNQDELMHIDDALRRK